MSIPVTRIERYLRRKTTAQDRENLLRLQKAFDLHDDDTMWPILFALDYHRSLYAAIPHAIEQASQGIVADAATGLKAQVDGSATAAAAVLKRAVSSVEAAAEAVAVMQFRIMTCLVAAIAIVPLLALAMVWAAASHAAANCELPTIGGS